MDSKRGKSEEECGQAKVKIKRENGSSRKSVKGDGGEVIWVLNGKSL